MSVRQRLWLTRTFAALLLAATAQPAMAQPSSPPAAHRDRASPKQAEPLTPEFDERPQDDERPRTYAPPQAEAPSYVRPPEVTTAGEGRDDLMGIILLVVSLIGLLLLFAGVIYQFMRLGGQIQTLSERMAQQQDEIRRLNTLIANGASASPAPAAHTTPFRPAEPPRPQDPPPQVPFPKAPSLRPVSPPAPPTPVLSDDSRLFAPLPGPLPPSTRPDTLSGAPYGGTSGAFPAPPPPYIPPPDIDSAFRDYNSLLTSDALTSDAFDARLRRHGALHDISLSTEGGLVLTPYASGHPARTVSAVVFADGRALLVPSANFIKEFPIVYRETLDNSPETRAVFRTMRDGTGKLSYLRPATARVDPSGRLSGLIAGELGGFVR